MLYTEAIESGTFSVLNKLMRLSSLQAFSLVGGTALALRYGHRSSIDLDLFSNTVFDNSIIINELSHEFGLQFDFESGHRNQGVFCYLKRIKVDIVYYPHPLIGNEEVHEGIRMYTDADIAAMKIQAILGRGKKKDFWDLYELLQYYSIQQIMDWHKQKYPNQMLAISIPNAITYFADADESETPVSYKNQTWPEIKADIQKIVSEYLR